MTDPGHADPSHAARLPDSGPLAEAVTGWLRAAPDGFFRITTHSGCLVCA